MNRDLREAPNGLEQPPLVEAFLRGQTARAYSLLDAGVEPLVRQRVSTAEPARPRDTADWAATAA